MAEWSADVADFLGEVGDEWLGGDPVEVGEEEAGF
jgi:hypothetical protein